MSPLRILLPTDFSALSQESAVFGLHLCAATHAEPVFVHVTEGAEPDPRARMLELIGQAYQEAGIAGPAEPVIDIVQNEKPFRGIMESVEKFQAGAVVMGTHGYGGLRSMLVGSQTASLIGQSPCPVVAIPQGTTYQPVTKIGFSTDLNDLFDRISRVMHLLKPLDATLDLFHIYPVFPSLHPVEEVEVNSLLSDLSSKLDYPKLNFHFVHTRSDNDGHAGVAEYLRCYKPDWLAMVTSPKTVFDALVTGSLTKEMLGQISVPLLAYSDPD